MPSDSIFIKHAIYIKTLNTKAGSRKKWRSTVKNYFEIHSTSENDESLQFKRETI